VGWRASRGVNATTELRGPQNECPSTMDFWINERSAVVCPCWRYDVIPW